MEEYEQELEYESAMSDSDKETETETHGMIAYMHVIVEQCLTCRLQIRSRIQ